MNRLIFRAWSGWQSLEKPLVVRPVAEVRIRLHLWKLFSRSCESVFSVILRQSGPIHCYKRQIVLRQLLRSHNSDRWWIPDCVLSTSNPDIFLRNKWSPALPVVFREDSWGHCYCQPIRRSGFPFQIPMHQLHRRPPADNHRNVRLAIYRLRIFCFCP